MELGGAYSDERLIELVRNRESLFDRTRPDYKDEAVKAAAWASISQILNMPPEDCQNRWVRLRERFGRELRMRQLGQSEDIRGVRRPWPLFNQMYWLRRFIQPRNRFSNNPARLVCQAAQATSSEHNIATTNANYESQSAGALWAPLWATDENSVSAETMEDVKNADMGDDEVLDGATVREEDLREDETTDPFWALNELHGGQKRRDDSLDASLAASLISVSAALSGLARRIQEDKRSGSCASGCDNEEEFGRSIATLVRNLPLNRRMGVKARILAVLASETASAAQEENSTEDRHNANRDGQMNAK